MNRFLFALLFICIQFLLYSCAKSISSEPDPGSETHFLRWCDDCDRECGKELHCIDSICTKECKTDKDCTRLYPDAKCRMPEADCAGPRCRGVCDLPCAVDDVCRTFSEKARFAKEYFFTCHREFCREGLMDNIEIDDFEDGNNRSFLGGVWFTFNDESKGGKSIDGAYHDENGNIVMETPGRDSNRGFYFPYEFDEGDLNFPPFVGCGVTMYPDQDSLFNMKGYSGISYDFKGSVHRLQLVTEGIDDDNYHNVKVDPSDVWTRVTLPFGSMRQRLGETADLELDKVKAINWLMQGETGEKGWVLIDNVDIYDAFEEIIQDVEVPDANPPEREQPGNIDIPNPLQALALEHLNRGYIIPNRWEENRFDGFGEYNEQFIANLADNGFKSLKLPIDLDLYILNLDDYLSGQAEFEIDPQLFLILDSFEQWTSTYGISFTIDYHQTDGSYSLRDEYKEAVKRMWVEITKYFINNSREDLFFQLVNAAEFHRGVDAFSDSQSSWTDFAEQIITAIRQYDTDRILLFGDVEANAIEPLSKRIPFIDPRIIYVFHFYEPYLFTLQGAQWVEMDGTHDIPYPYSPDRWSANYDDLGLNTLKETKWEPLIETYPDDAHKSALWNKILIAKKWGARHNVPVICNQFGVYKGGAPKKDRLDYYRDLIDIFEELEIPWQHWYEIIDPHTGAVDQEMAAAMRL